MNFCVALCLVKCIFKSVTEAIFVVGFGGPNFVFLFVEVIMEQAKAAAPKAPGQYTGKRRMKYRGKLRARAGLRRFRFICVLGRMCARGKSKIS